MAMQRRRRSRGRGGEQARPPATPKEEASTSPKPKEQASPKAKEQAYSSPKSKEEAHSSPKPKEDTSLRLPRPLKAVPVSGIGAPEFTHATLAAIRSSPAGSWVGAKTGVQ